jgi:hypothetical protein
MELFDLVDDFMVDVVVIEMMNPWIYRVSSGNFEIQQPSTQNEGSGEAFFGTTF